MLRRCVNNSWIYAVRMNPVLNRSSVLQYFKCCNVIKIRNGIMFDFSPGLPHICLEYLIVIILPAPSFRSKSIISFLSWKPQSARRLMPYVTPLFSMRQQIFSRTEHPTSDAFISRMACLSMDVSPSSMAY